MSEERISLSGCAQCCEDECVNCSTAEVLTVTAPGGGTTTISIDGGDPNFTPNSWGTGLLSGCSILLVCDDDPENPGNVIYTATIGSVTCVESQEVVADVVSCNPLLLEFDFSACCLPGVWTISE